MSNVKAQMTNQILMSNDKKKQVTGLLDLGFWHSFDIWILAFGFFFAPLFL
jgi:hypothetical protein